MSEAFLEDVVVVELGDREAVGDCGALLSELGATVFFIEPPSIPAVGKWTNRALAAAGKQSLRIDPSSDGDAELLQALIAIADVILTSSDLGMDWAPFLAGAGRHAVHCDLTAFGRSGPMAGKPYPDTLMQAFSGAMSVTGQRDGAPTLSDCPYIEGATAAIGAAAVLVGLRVARRSGLGQRADVAMLDTAVSMNATFLAQYLSGIEPVRIGNRHVAMAPWNAYRTSDGWVLLCTGSDDQWTRVCDAIGQPGLVDEPAFNSPRKRVAEWRAVDARVEAWTRSRSTEACILAFNARQLPCGPVYSLAQLLQDPSLRARDLFRRAEDPVTGKAVPVAGSAFRATRSEARHRLSIPPPDGGRQRAMEAVSSRRGRRPPQEDDIGGLPLAGLRVIEIGTYTTAPSCARQLGALGADVIKVEPPAGDPARGLPPHLHDQGVFFTLSNSDKRAVSLDLRSPDGLARFKRLLQRADVFVENLRPGSLVQFGLGPEDLARINPGLIYCSITGFGIASPFAGRGAMDTTVQAMSGIMDLTRDQDDMPVKVGISIADTSGGQYALIAVLAALEARERTGQGQWIDLSMQDVSARLTERNWSGSRAPTAILSCADGWLLCGIPPGAERMLPAQHRSHAALSRQELQAAMESEGFICSPVQTLEEVMRSEQIRQRQDIVVARDCRQNAWQLLASPLRLDRTPPEVRRAIGPQGSDTTAVFQDWLQET